MYNCNDLKTSWLSIPIKQNFLKNSQVHAISRKQISRLYFYFNTGLTKSLSWVVWSTQGHPLGLEVSWNLQNKWEKINLEFYP